MDISDLLAVLLLISLFFVFFVFFCFFSLFCLFFGPRAVWTCFVQNERLKIPSPFNDPSLYEEIYKWEQNCFPRFEAINTRLSNVIFKHEVLLFENLGILAFDGHIFCFVWFERRNSEIRFLELAEVFVAF